MLQKANKVVDAEELAKQRYLVQIYHNTCRVMLRNGSENVKPFKVDLNLMESTGE